MIVLEQISNPYLASLVVGVIYGLTFCTTLCMPYLVSYIAGVKAGFRKGVIITATYNFGRVIAYAIIGSLIGVFTSFIDSIFLSAYQQVFSIIFGLVIIIIGVSIFFRKSHGNCCNAKSREPKWVFRSLKQRFDVRAFSMGFTKGLVICPALLAVLFYSITQVNVNLALIAILFGLGTSISPLLLLGGAVGWLLEKAPDFRKYLSYMGGVLLIFLGIYVLLLVLVEL